MKLMNFIWIVALGLIVFETSATAVTMNFTGQVRTEGDLYTKGSLGLQTNDSKAFLSTRALLFPKLVIDDHFTLHSQWNALTSKGFTPDATQAPGLSVGQGGFVFGDPTTNSLVLNRVWLEWTSDFGVVRIGRMPVSWGYGLLFDAGNNTWDDFQTTLDRLEYRLVFGHVIGALAYSKGWKKDLVSNNNDQEFYTIYLRYDSPEEEVEGGLLYERQVRSSGQKDDFTSGAGNPYKHSSITGATNILARTPYPMSNNILDLYFKKSWGKLSMGGEGAWMTGSAMDFNLNGVEDSLNAFGVMANVSYDWGKVKTFMDFTYASGDNDLNSDHLNGFVLLHRNRRAGLILGKELIGNYFGNNLSLGSMVVYGNTGSFSGVYYFRPGIRVEWSPSWVTGVEVIAAQKAAKQTAEEGNLGVESLA
jgi:hypothetical protein